MSHPVVISYGSRLRGSLERWIIGSCWIAACAFAIVSAMGYEFKPGRVGERRSSWPNDPDYSYATAIRRHPGATTILAFLHPRCVCSRATVTQLLKTLERHPGAELIVPVYTPLTPKDRTVWEESAYVKTIRSEIPSAHVVFDRGGVQAWRFGAFTSGTILVYDGMGREVFRGGITDRRGGEGENRGLQEFGGVLAGNTTAQTASSPVFGCPLINPDSVEGVDGKEAHGHELGAR